MSSPPELLHSSDSASTLSINFPIKIVLPGVAVLSILLLFVLIIYFRVKNQSDPFDSSRLALDPAVLKALTTTVFGSANSDCAICLADLADGELGRFLPRCNHGFHLRCIDEWFLVNSNCPICRSSVDPQQKLSASFSGTKSATLVVKEGTLQPPVYSTAAAQAAVESSGSEGREEIMLPAMARRMKNSCCSSRGWDVEQGVMPAAGVGKDFR